MLCENINGVAAYLAGSKNSRDFTVMTRPNKYDSI